MKMIYVVSESVHALRSNVLRSILTITGIVVGIFSVTGMLAIGNGLSNSVMDRFSSFSQGDISIQGDVTVKDLEWIRGLSFTKSAVATVTLPSANTVIGSESFNPTVQSAFGDYSELQKFTLSQGEIFDFHDAAYADSVAVVTDKFEDTVQEKLGYSSLNKSVRINNQTFSIIGIITLPSASFQRGDGMILVPAGALFGSLTNSRSYSNIAIKLVEPEYYNVVSEYIRQSLNVSRNLPKDDTDELNFASAQSFIESAQETTRMFSVFLGVVGAIALFVGGIGTMNMMLTTISERTAEIGLRKAVGATNRDILSQILTESVLVTFIGGVIGIVLTVIGARFINSIMQASESPLSMVVSSNIVILAAMVSLVVGVIFGMYPAYRASRLMPVEALRKD